MATPCGQCVQRETHCGAGADFASLKNDVASSSVWDVVGFCEMHIGYSGLGLALVLRRAFKEGSELIYIAYLHKGLGFQGRMSCQHNDTVILLMG